MIVTFCLPSYFSFSPLFLRFCLFFEASFCIPYNLPYHLFSICIITGISSVEFSDDLTISSMTSPEGECVPFLTSIDPKNKNIEVWMVEVKDAMIGKKQAYFVCYCLYLHFTLSYIKICEIMLEKLSV